MKLPCQVIVWDVLPAIRAAIAEELIACGSTQQEAAVILDCAPSAISQYLSGKRGYRIVFEDEIRSLIRDLAADLHAGAEKDLAARICRICVELRKDDGACGSCEDDHD
ncbi:transcriptional regulator [Methanocalculus chunghsingensis]|uniref:Transcriptional regulator n=1 Tax=Methanocalculus chunghsingensis TaxID=156457 RepID=A0A8J8B6K8_9EURY|nr:transcriptional regulator [Methanocalculus chunghsingensis]MBR1368772.1 transcriptional regulator [Methanocalculus chunghsingensis]